MSMSRIVPYCCRVHVSKIFKINRFCFEYLREGGFGFAGIPIVSKSWSVMVRSTEVLPGLSLILSLSNPWLVVKFLMTLERVMLHLESVGFPMCFRLITMG